MLNEKALHRKHRSSKFSSRLRTKGGNHPQGTKSEFRRLEGDTKRPVPSIEVDDELEIPEPQFWVYLENEVCEAFETKEGDFFIEASLFGEGYITQKFYVSRQEIYMES